MTNDYEAMERQNPFISVCKDPHIFHELRASLLILSDELLWVAHGVRSCWSNENDFFYLLSEHLTYLSTPFYFNDEMTLTTCT